MRVSRLEHLVLSTTIQHPVSIWWTLYARLEVVEQPILKLIRTQKCFLPLDDPFRRLRHKQESEFLSAAQSHLPTPDWCLICSTLYKCQSVDISSNPAFDNPFSTSAVPPSIQRIDWLNTAVALILYKVQHTGGTVLLCTSSCNETAIGYGPRSSYKPYFIVLFDLSVSLIANPFLSLTLPDSACETEKWLVEMPATYADQSFCHLFRALMLDVSRSFSSRYTPQRTDIAHWTEREG